MLRLKNVKIGLKLIYQTSLLNKQKLVLHYFDSFISCLAQPTYFCIDETPKSEGDNDKKRKKRGGKGIAKPKKKDGGPKRIR